jgi:hypothetical protein
MQLVLAKNGHPTPDDMGSATELISLVGRPAVSLHLFSFLIRRCVANIDTRIHNLHISIRGLHHDFCQRWRSISWGLMLPLSFQVRAWGIWRCGASVCDSVFVEEIIDMTAQGLNAGDVSSRKKYIHIVFLVDALRYSCFLKTLVEDCNFPHRNCQGMAEKLKRLLDKVYQYPSGISHLIQKAKRLFPTPLGYGHFHREGRG